VANLAGDATLLTHLRAGGVLQDSPELEALTTLTALVVGGRTFFGRAQLAPVSPVVLAALQALAARFPDDPAARPYLALARASSLPAVQAAVTSAAS
jgi:hypothetical protein